MSESHPHRASRARKQSSNGAGRLDTLKTGARHFARSALHSLETALEQRASRTPARERPHDLRAGAWLSKRESLQLEALATQIVPSDSTGPGAREARVVETLDGLLAASPSRQALYAEGLNSLDRWSRKQRGTGFVELAPGHQLELMRQIDLLSEAGSEESGTWRRLAGRVFLLYRKIRFPVLRLFPVLVDDVLQAFYTSPVAWEWLGYDGPPMPAGYSELARFRP